MPSATALKRERTTRKLSRTAARAWREVSSGIRAAGSLARAIGNLNIVFAMLPSVPPSLLATALVLQTYDGVSDDEARQRAAYDLRWKVALGVAVDARPFAKSTLQEFRAQLIVHQEQAAIFQQSLALAQRQGQFRTPQGDARPLKVALDTTNILGRGAVKDTYNLLADGLRHVLRVLARQAGEALEPWATAAGYSRTSAGRLTGGLLDPGRMPSMPAAG